MPQRSPLRRCVLLTLSLLSACGAAGMQQDQSSGAAAASVTGAAGSYLAAHFAADQGDHERAADLFEKGLRLDPASPEMLQGAFLSSLMAGRANAVRLAARLPDNIAASLLLGDAEVKDGKWAAAQARYAAMVRQGVPQLLQPLLLAWAQFGDGKTEAALATLRSLAEGQRFRGAYALHAALIADAAGSAFDQEALRYYRIAQAEFGNGNLQVMRAVASWQARQGKLAEAQATLNAMVAQTQDLAIVAPAIYAHSTQRPVQGAQDGIAEAYVALAGALRGPETNDFALLLLHLALDLRPDLSAARLLAADLLDGQKRPAQALAMLKPVGDDDPLAGLVRLRQVTLMARTGDLDGALALTDTLARRYPDRPEPAALRGDVLRDMKRFADAVTAYDLAVSRTPHQTRSDWVLFYERGIANERSQNWPRAEADFLRALELSPDEPSVLNYLGYSWTEQGRNLPRARAMIERAVQKRPNEGAFVDSLGWVVLRQGRVMEAVKLLERATELDPSDSTINGHLGDAYWAAGKKLLAQFQWRRALTQNPDPDDLPKLQAKLRESEQALGNIPIAQAAVPPPAPAAP